jgi:hypothetical protein
MNKKVENFLERNFLKIPFANDAEAGTRRYFQPPWLWS